MKATHPAFHNENAARKHLEKLRWPDGVYCPFCGTKEAVKALGGKSMGAGWYHCGECRDKFTVRVGTLFERSKIPLHKWLLGFRLMASSKKGFSAHQLHRTLDITYKSAWFMAHRIREAMREGADFGPMGDESQHVEVDETYIGKKIGVRKGGGGWRHTDPPDSDVITLENLKMTVENFGRLAAIALVGLNWDGKDTAKSPLRLNGIIDALPNPAHSSLLDQNIVAKFPIETEDVSRMWR